MIVLVGNVPVLVLVLVLVLGTSVLETSLPIINPKVNAIACSNVTVYRQSKAKQCYFSYDFLVIVIVIVTHFLSF